MFKQLFPYIFLLTFGSFVQITSQEANFKSCCEALKRNPKATTANILLNTYKSAPFLASCNNEIDDGGWTVIMRRSNSKLSFDRPWIDYMKGFGDCRQDFWIGLEKLHAMTTSQLQELYVELEDFDNQTRYAKYGLFAIGDEDERFALKLLFNYTGTAGDSLSYHKNFRFSAHDMNLDASNGNCARMFSGGWWFGDCMHSSLFGTYYYDNDKHIDGIIWKSFRGLEYSYKFVQMLIRPVRDA